MPDLLGNIKDFLAGSGPLKKAAATGDQSQPAGTPNNIPGGNDPSYMMKMQQAAQDNANRQLAAEKAARAVKTTSAPAPGKTPITVKGKGKKSAPVNPQDVLAAPRQ